MSDIGVLEAIHTARALRKLKPDPVPEAVITQVLDAAIRAPSAGNAQNWAFVVVRDAGQRRKLGAIYRKAFETYRSSPMYAGSVETGDAARDAQQQRVASSADYLAEHMGEAPVLGAASSANSSPARNREGRIMRSGFGACGSLYAALSQR